MRGVADTPSTASYYRDENERRGSSLGLQHGRDAEVWQIFILNWKLLAAITGAVVTLLVTTEFRIEPFGYAMVITIAALCWRIGLGRLNAKLWHPRISFSLVAFGQFIFAFSIMTTLTYLTTAIGFSLQDKLLLAWDLALGLDFRSFLGVINRHPEWMKLLGPSYASISWQMLLLIVVLPLLGHYRRVAEAMCVFILSLLATTCISALVPAIGVYDVLQLTPADYPHFEPQGYYITARDAPLLRSGALRLLELSRLGGVLTFPSFHAVCAVLFIWAFWPIVWLRFLVVPLNAAMIMATPLGGGHYFVDVILGIVIAPIAILAARRLGELHAARGGMTMAPISIPESAEGADQKLSIPGEALP